LLNKKGRKEDLRPTLRVTLILTTWRMTTDLMRCTPMKINTWSHMSIVPTTSTFHPVSKNTITLSTKLRMNYITSFNTQTMIHHSRLVIIITIGQTHKVLTITLNPLIIQHTMEDLSNMIPQKDTFPWFTNRSSPSTTTPIIMPKIITLKKLSLRYIL
jgi:hypothetical protein